MPRLESARPSDPRHPYYATAREEQARRPTRDDVRDFLFECDAFRAHVRSARILESVQ